MKKRALCFLLVMVLSFTLALPASAANADCRMTAIAGGMSHSLALKTDGTVWAWGDNASGQLGLGADTAQQGTPKKIPDLTSVTAVAAGYDFSLALRYDGKVWAWGGGVSQTPAEVPGLENIVAISAGQTDCLALRTDGRVFQWTLGEQPHQVQKLQNIVAIDAGGGHFLAVTRQGDAWSWGANFAGQLGDGTTADRDVPQKISGLMNVIDVAAGTNHSLAVDHSGAVYAWGGNSYSQLGTKELETGEENRPRKVENLKNVVQVAAGNSSSLALTAGGKLYSWGYGEYGQLGNGSSDISRERPVEVRVSDADNPPAVTSITCGVYHSMFLDKNNVLYAWGRNNSSQIGVNRNTNANSPTKVSSGIVAENWYEFDVTSGSGGWSKPSIEALYEAQCIPPVLLADYQSPLTRGELAHLLISVYERTKAVVTVHLKETYTDIQGHPYETDMLKACQLGILSGTKENKCNPDQRVTRQEAAVALCKFVMKMEGVSISQTVRSLSYYTDAGSIAEWAAPYVAYAYQHHIMRGSDGKFNPKGQFTREQILATVAQMMQTYKWTVA